MARNAVLAFGLVNVPVGVEPAAKRRDVSFKNLHRVCGTPIKQQQICENCDTVVSSGDIVKGYEYAKGQFLRFEVEEIQNSTAPRSSVIQIEKFVNEDLVPATMFETTYWLSQNETLKEPYVLLMQALTDLNVFGLGKCSLWGKEYPVAVWTDTEVLYLTTLYASEDMREPSRPDLSGSEGFNRDLARELVAAMIMPLDPNVDLASSSRQRMHAMIEAKMAGEVFQIPESPPEPEPTIDIQSKLQESIDRIRASRANA